MKKPKLVFHRDKVFELEDISDGNQPSPSVGSHGAEAILILDLTGIADVSLVGMPYAGKSTLLDAISS
ncbi:P-loop containing nucleoside triphosphate hydrolase [Parasponia andersonii]|uniref:P-loop containing nucleoside triphosphate hydrolase n=1 Tax=Parasponia andersonii TaxID=3476 RepID=A0A2P5AJI7_PARAD|nr:P-loop containing nucleoside triphosphate hydrolase [Parasponia andersonii]